MIGRRGLLGGVVAWWASGNARQPEGPQTREAGRLDRRVLGTQPAGVGPAPSPGTFIGRLIILSGTGANRGFFVYNGTPAKGNLVAAIVAPGVTSDPYGNTVSAVANFGTWNAAGTLLQHFGINISGDTFLANSSGLTVVHEHSADGSIWFYSTAGEGAGNLRASIAPAAGTDSSGNSYLTGISTYGPGVPASQLISSTLQFRVVGNPPAFTPQVSGPAATPAGASLTLASGQGTAGATAANIQLLDSLQDAVQSGTGVAQMIVNAGAFANPVTSALLEVQGAIQTTSLAAIIANGNLQTTLGDIISSAGNLLINTIGKGLRVKEGTNAKQGTALLAGGTATVNNTNVTASSRIFLTAQDNLSTGALRVSARVAGTSFTITSSVAGDSGSVAWEIFEPA